MLSSHRPMGPAGCCLSLIRSALGLMSLLRRQNTWALAPNCWPCPPAYLCRIAEVQREYLLEPSGEIAIQRVPALIQAVSAARVEDQLLRLARAYRSREQRSDSTSSA